LIIDILNDDKEKVTVRYDLLRARISVNRGETLGFKHPLFSPCFETTCEDVGDLLRLYLLVDQSLLEVFVNGGLKVCTTVFYMRAGPPSEVSVRAESGEVKAEDLRVYTLKSIWK
jgi:sucrose-6-phosphate hydrolase SacC (GH32 family)